LFNKAGSTLVLFPCGISDTSYTIPSGVSSIGDSAFRGCSKLTSVSTESAYTSIGSYAFEGCTNLATVNFPQNVYTIGSNAFDGCAAFSTETLPNGLSEISSYVFRGCTSLKRIAIPSSVSTIKTFAFDGCKNLESVTFNGGISSIGANAFQFCTSLKSISLPPTTKEIATGAFKGCTSLESVDIPELVKTIGWTAFGECSDLKKINVDQNNKYFESKDGVLYSKGLTSLLAVPSAKSGELSIPDTVTSIDSGAFSGCGKITSIKFPSGWTQLSDSLFLGCTGLKSFTIPETITSIGMNAFSGCKSLSSVTIPKRVENIKSGAFSNCHNLEIKVDSKNHFFKSSGGVLFDVTGTSLTRHPGKGKSYTVSGDAVIIKQSSFSSSGMEAVAIPSSVVSIETKAFEGSAKLKYIYYKGSYDITDCPADAFDGCDKLTKACVSDNYKKDTFCGKPVSHSCPQSMDSSSLIVPSISLVSFIVLCICLYL